MRYRVWLAALTLAAACSEIETSPAHSVTVDPTCSSHSVQLYSGIFYTNTALCLQGLGRYSLPRGFDIRSYKAGLYYGSFDHDYATPPVAFDPYDYDALANMEVVNAHTVYLTDSLVPPDAGIDAP